MVMTYDSTLVMSEARVKKYHQHEKWWRKVKERWRKIGKVLLTVSIELLKAFTGITAIIYGIKAIRDAKSAEEKVFESLSLLITVIPGVGAAGKLLKTGTHLLKEVKVVSKLARGVEMVVHVPAFAKSPVAAVTKANVKRINTALRKIIAFLEHPVPEILDDFQAAVQAVQTGIESLKPIVDEAKKEQERQANEKLPWLVARILSVMPAKEINDEATQCLVETLKAVERPQSEGDDRLINYGKATYKRATRRQKFLHTGRARGVFLLLRMAGLQEEVPHASLAETMSDFSRVYASLEAQFADIHDVKKLYVDAFKREPSKRERLSLQLIEDHFFLRAYKEITAQITAHQKFQ